jgi:pimeloyl-ACP methyl ester carboxylesterase
MCSNWNGSAPFIGVYTPTITTKDGTEIFYKDWGSGRPIVFSHGWPLSADDWDAQLLFFLHHGYRVIAHDRRRYRDRGSPGEALVKPGDDECRLRLG